MPKVTSFPGSRLYGEHPIRMISQANTGSTLSYLYGNGGNDILRAAAGSASTSMWGGDGADH